ncbi:MAG: polysaccharide lyase family 7 protein [Verrucomicrobiales bacterium]|jgi:hypothetical protein|nr:polysaccharide lyase family 7 protein [Verrucomicrobiales bacterium]MDP4639040.1 polysaccharide lyase family 7 protein [Verrucomicrobiales bacterium]MDP4939131.1 polysaccharide lyase family 7 protein [Verrucomicrobiales bacterium]
MATPLKSVRLLLSVAGVLAGLFSLTAPAANYAGDVFSLEIWSLTIPLDDDGDGYADPVLMPTLRNFEDPDFFHLSPTRDSIIFKVRSDGAKAENAAHPSCLLRELKKSSEAPASWSATDGLVHNLTTTLAIHRPSGPAAAVVATGIFSDDEDVLTLRLDDEKLLLTRAGMEPLLLDDVYVPGTLFDFMLIVEDGRARAFYKGASLEAWSLERDNLHFRAGCEVRLPAAGGGASGDHWLGEVEIQKLYVTHKS